MLVSLDTELGCSHFAQGNPGSLERNQEKDANNAKGIRAYEAQRKEKGPFLVLVHEGRVILDFPSLGSLVICSLLSLAVSLTRVLARTRTSVLRHC